MTVTGEPEPAIVEKIRKLLAVADRTPNQEEARTFLAKAQALMAEHNLSEAAARADRPDLVHEEVWRGRTLTATIRSASECLQSTCFVVVSYGHRFNRDGFDAAWNEYEAIPRNIRYTDACDFDESRLKSRPHMFRVVMLTGRSENVAVGRYMLTFIERQFREGLRRDKPASQLSWLEGAASGLRYRLAEERKILGSKSETNALAVMPRRLIDEAQQHLEAICGSLGKMPERKDKHEIRDALKGFDAGKSIELNRPLAEAANDSVRKIGVN